MRMVRWSACGRAMRGWEKGRSVHPRTCRSEGFGVSPVTALVSVRSRIRTDAEGEARPVLAFRCRLEGDVNVYTWSFGCQGKGWRRARSRRERVTPRPSLLWESTLAYCPFGRDHPRCTMRVRGSSVL